MQNYHEAGASFEDSEMDEAELDDVSGGVKTPTSKGGDTLSQQEASYLQKSLDHRSNFLGSLSNIEKKGDDTVSAIIQNK